ncbi:hypothetical protein ACFQ4Y_00870 [Kroppenstedtia sanguinis]|uniref:Uncharacterized protein n=1 Tax=Kroppenstedtia sanguinis TaxID=1380684 RepID=A0ABW4C445_9BACL
MPRWVEEKRDLESKGGGAVKEESDRFYLERVHPDLDVFKIKKKERKLGTVVATGEQGSLRFVATDGRRSVNGKTRKKAARRLLKEEEE